MRVHVCVLDGHCWKMFRHYGAPMRIYVGHKFWDIPILSRISDRKSQEIWDAATPIRLKRDMGKAPDKCMYCKDGTGRWEKQPAPNECGFCDNGKPLDTQEDWDNSWGRVLGDEA